jgi:hypothetical protein
VGRLADHHCILQAQLGLPPASKDPAPIKELLHIKAQKLSLDEKSNMLHPVQNRQRFRKLVLVPK